jgi:D-arabinose 1-dehydrogenase-like Zn-dependent alcohol dehydrogenase
MYRVFGVVPLAQGSVIVCHRSKVALIPESMDTALAAASVGQLAFVSSAVMDFMKTACPKTTKILLHAGRCSPAAIATYNFLKVNDFDTMITVSDQPLSRIVLGVSSRFLPFSSNKFLAWRSGARSWAPNGVNIVFNFDYDPNVAEESISLLSAKGQFIQVGGDLPHKLPRGYNFISIDYEDIVKENMISYAIDVVASTMSSCVAPPLEIYSISQLSSAYSRARSSFRADATVLLNLHDIDPQLPVLKGGIIRGTPVFDPRASYVVIGGIGGLGASISRCLVENGAKHIVLTSRSGEKAGSFNPVI